MTPSRWYDRLIWRLQDLRDAVLAVTVIGTPIVVGILWLACVIGMPILVAISLIKWILT